MKKKINIWIGSDHGGFDLKCDVMESLISDERYSVCDVGSYIGELNDIHN